VQRCWLTRTAGRVEGQPLRLLDLVVDTLIGYSMPVISSNLISVCLAKGVPLVFA